MKTQLHTFLQKHHLKQTFELVNRDDYLEVLTEKQDDSSRVIVRFFKINDAKSAKSAIEKIEVLDVIVF